MQHRAGPALAIVGVLGFSFKAILVKLGYSLAPVDAVTLLALRMIYATPFFAVMAWWATRREGTAPIARSDWVRLVWLGFVGYYIASLLDFMGLEHVTASIERLILFLYPTMVVPWSAVLFKQRIGGAPCWPLRCRGGILPRRPRPPRYRSVTRFGGGWCSPVRSATRSISSAQAPSSRLGSLRFISGNADFLGVRDRAVPRNAPHCGTRRAPVHPTPFVGDGDMLDCAADLSHCRGDQAYRRESNVVDRVARTGIHHCAGFLDPW
jgi:hypothetical protein